MTPEERAREIANGFFLDNPIAYKNLETRIAAAIRTEGLCFDPKGISLEIAAAILEA